MKWEWMKPVSARLAAMRTSSCSSMSELTTIFLTSSRMFSLTRNMLNIPKFCSICNAANRECQLLYSIILKKKNKTKINTKIDYLKQTLIKFTLSKWPISILEHSSLRIHIEMAIRDIANWDLTVTSWAAILSTLHSYYFWFSMKIKIYLFFNF